MLICRKSDAPSEATSDDGYWVDILKADFQLLEALELSKPAPTKEPKKEVENPN